MMKENRTPEDLIEKAYQLGFDYEKKYRGCSQCTLAAIYDTLEFNDDNIADPDEFAKFEAAGGHDDKCTEVVGRATRLAVRYILEQKLLVV